MGLLYFCYYCFNLIAAVSPAIPPPTIATSYDIFYLGGSYDVEKYRNLKKSLFIARIFLLFINVKVIK
jgi:hypothetical protein